MQRLSIAFFISRSLIYLQFLCFDFYLVLEQSQEDSSHLGLH